MPGVLPYHLGRSGDIIALTRPGGPRGVGPLIARVLAWSDWPPDTEIEVEPLIRSLSPADVATLEVEAPPPAGGPSLNAIFRIRTRGLGWDLDSLEALRVWIQAAPDVLLTWLELAVSLPGSLWWERGYASDQVHLCAAPDGHGVRARWGLPGAAGAGAHLYVVEHGWELRHPDLQRRGLVGPIFGDNAADKLVKGPADLRRINHGAAALSLVAGVDDRPGRIGIAPELSSVTLVSAYDAARDTGEDVASAILAAIQDHVTRGLDASVLMLQVQRGLYYATEIDLADFLAIRLASRYGITVVEPAGNGGGDAVPDPWPDSGAIMVGAADTSGPLPFSGGGPRVDVAAAGRDVACSGAPIGPRGIPDRSAGGMHELRRSDFGGTSAATAIITGLACSLAGRSRALRYRPNGPTIRAALMKTVDGALRPDLQRAQDQDLGAGVKLSVARFPFRPRAMWTRHGWVGVALPVTNPQTGEGNTNICSVDESTGADLGAVGYVRTLPLPGSGHPHAVPGGAPPTQAATDPSWTERWILPSASVLTSPPAAGTALELRYEAPSSAANPNGDIWSPAVRSYFQGLAGGATWSLAEPSFRYLPIPAPPSPSISDSGWTRQLYEVRRQIGGSWSKVGELLRRVQENNVEDRWALWDNYRFADAGDPVRLVYLGAPAQSTQDWHVGVQQAAGGGAPRPTWYVYSSVTIGTL